MNITIEPDTFSSALKAAEKIVDECKLHFTDDGIRITAVDPANVAMVDMSLSESAFETYDVEPATLGINMDRILTLTDRIANQPTLDDDDEDIMLMIGFNSDTRKITLSGGIHDFDMALIDPDSIRDEPDIPELNMGAHAHLQKEWLSDGIGAANTLTDRITLGVDENEHVLYMEAHGDTDNWRMEMDEKNGLIKLDAAPANALFSLDYLKSIKGAIPSGNIVELELDKEYPMKLHSNLAGGEGEVTYNIAPRVESD